MNKSNTLIITLFLISHLTLSSCSSDATISENNSEEVVTSEEKGDEIAVSFKASGINLQMEEGWSWAETDYFQFGDNGIKLVKKDQSKVERSHF
jgi:hypothetical protein